MQVLKTHPVLPAEDSAHITPVRNENEEYQKVKMSSSLRLVKIFEK